MANRGVIEAADHESNMNEVLDSCIGKLCETHYIGQLDRWLILCRFLKLLAMAIMHLLWKVDQYGRR